MNSYNDDGGENENRPRFRVGWIYLIAAILIAFIVFYIVRNLNATSVATYYDADVMVETDSDGKVSKTDGPLAEILYTKNVTSLSQENHPNADYIYLYGSYTETTSENRSVRRSFAAYLTAGNTEAVSDYYTIINTRTISSTDTRLFYSAQNENLSYSVSDYTTRTSIWDYLPTILLWVIIIGAGIWMVSRLNRSIGNANSAQFNFNSSRAKKETHSKVRFSDVAGCDEVKAELAEMVDYFKNGKKYTRLGAKLPKGILLQGPPGTGKTLLAKAVAGEANVPFYSISGSDFVEMYVGVGAGRVRDMFRVAKQNAPCLIFIDEIDAVGRQRGAGLGGGNDEREQTLNQLLVEMDGFEENSGVIVMAATNRADVLDPALLRAGRFDRTITVDLPDKEGRAAILKVHAKNKIMAKDVDFNAIASRTVGFSGADLANILNDAAILAVRENKNAIDMSDIDEAIDRSIAGPAKTNRGLSPEEKRRVAYHEAGHAVIGIHLQNSEKVQRITIIPRGRTGGHVLMTPSQDRFLMTKRELEEEITGLLGGRVSEEIIFGDVSTGASNDIEKATEIARAMVVEYGMSDLGPIQYEKNTGSVFLGRDYTSAQQRYSSAMALEIDKAVRKIIDECYAKAKEVLNTYRDDLELISQTLQDKETITAEQIDYLLKYRKMPEPSAPEVAKKEEPSAPSDSDKKEEQPEEKKVSEKPAEPAPEKKEEATASTSHGKEGEKFLSKIRSLKDSHVSLLVLFVEDPVTGIDMSPAKMKKVIRESSENFVEHITASGDVPPERGMILTGAQFADASLVREFESTPEEFGNFVEKESGVEVVLVKLSSLSFIKCRESFEKSQAEAPSVNAKAEKEAKDLTDLVDNETKKNRK